MEQYPYFPMGRTARIMRRSIFTFLKNYHYFTYTPSLLAFPFAASCILSQALIPGSSTLTLVQGRLRSLFLAAGFPPSSELFTILNIKLSQTICIYLFTLPFALLFLLPAKGSIIRALGRQRTTEGPTITSWIPLYNSIFATQICSSLVILAANATSFTLLLFAFNCFDVLGLSSSRSLLFLSATGAIVYSIILANAYVICNMAIVLSGEEKHGGYIAILKACFMIQGRNATALSLALPLNMALASAEALFQYRITRPFLFGTSTSTYSSMVLEGLFIAYIYAILLVLDTIVTFHFYKSCRAGYDHHEHKHFYLIEGIDPENGKSFGSSKVLEELP